MTRAGPVAILLCGLVAVFLLMPLIAVVPVSFTPKRFLSLPGDEWSWRHYQSLITEPEWRQSFFLSLRVGLVASALATVLGSAYALGIWMLRPRFAGLLIGVALLPMVAPPVVSALTLYYFLNSINQIGGIAAYDTWFGVAVAHAVMIVPFAVVVVSVALAQVDQRIDMAAKSMGADLRTRIFLVILPNIRFGVFGAFFLCFVLSWDEIGVTLFITSVNAITLPRRIWMGLRDNIDPAIASLSVILIALVALIIIARAVWSMAASKEQS